jgi:hypothetical protein
MNLRHPLGKEVDGNGVQCLETSSNNYDIRLVTPIILAHCNSSAMPPRMIRASSVEGNPVLDHVGSYVGIQIRE